MVCAVRLGSRSAQPAPLMLLLLSLLLACGLGAVAAAPGQRGRPATSAVGRGQGGGRAAMDAAHQERLVVVDTDAGGDDAVALLALLGAARERPPRVRVLAVTCVHGNTGLSNVTRNVVATLRTARRADVPVYPGAAASLVVTPHTDSYFGADGFGDFLPAVKQGAGSEGGQVKAEHAANALVRMAARQPGRITLVCLGPMTNVALAARLDPAFLDNLADVFVLGGSARAIGNTKASTEFNVYMDAEAFQAVLTSVTKPLFVLPWETVLNVGLTEEWRYGVLGALGSPQVELLNQAERRTMDRRGGLYAMGDGLLALVVVRPDIVRKLTTTRMEVVLGDGSARGATLVDYVNKNPGRRNVVLLEDADKALVECLLLRLLAAAPAPSAAPCAASPAASTGASPAAAKDGADKPPPPPPPHD